MIDSDTYKTRDPGPCALAQSRRTVKRVMYLSDCNEKCLYWHTAGTLVHVLARSGNKSPSIGWRARRRKSDGRSELKYWLDEHQGEASEKSVVGPGLDSISRAFEFDGRNATALAAAAAVHYERFKTVTLMMCPDHGTYKHIHHHGKWVVWRRLTSSHRFIQ